MTRVEQVSGWRTTDGKIYDIEAQAQEHQNWLDFEAWCCDRFEGHVAKTIWTSWHVSPRHVERPEG